MSFVARFPFRPTRTPLSPHCDWHLMFVIGVDWRTTGAYPEAADPDGQASGRDLRRFRGASGGRPESVDRTGDHLRTSTDSLPTSLSRSRPQFPVGMCATRLMRTWLWFPKRNLYDVALAQPLISESGRFRLCRSLWCPMRETFALSLSPCIIAQPHD